MKAPGGLRVPALVLLAALTLFLLFSPMAQALRHAVFDRYQRLFPLERTSAPVTIVAIDEPSLARFGQWPWPRTRLAELVVRLSNLGAASIGFDMVFPEPDRVSPDALARELPIISEALAKALEGLPSNDRRFADAMRGRHVVLGLGTEEDARRQAPLRAPSVAVADGIERTLQSFGAYTGSVEILDAAAAGRGVMNAGPPDQVVRRVPLVVRLQDVIVPSLAVETLRHAVGGDLRIERGELGLARLSFGDVAAPMSEDGSAWLRVGRHDPSRFVSAVDVIDGKLDREAFENKVVLVGIFGLGTFDYKTTPLGEFVPGVELHAQVVENLYSRVSLVRPPWMVLAEAGVLVAFGLLLVGVVPRTSALKSINMVAGIVLLLFAAGLLVFLHFHVLFDPAWPAIGTVAVYVTTMVGTLSLAERQRRQLRDQAARMAGEVDAARRIQMGLLPDPGRTLASDRRFALDAVLEPARTVGGDFYDCFLIDPERLFFVVADVSGKGLPAALFMASAKSQIKSAALRPHAAVGEVLTRAQAEIERENPEQLFVTAVAGVLDLSRGVLQLANAGQEPPYARTPHGAPERLSIPGGPPLCVVPDFEYPTTERQLAPGEWVLAVTDGVTEATDPAGAFFGGERLRTALSWVAEDVLPKDLVRRVREDLERYAAGSEPADDITVLALRWWGAGAAELSGR